MSVDYNNFSKTFAASRKNMRWEEIEYFFSLSPGSNILDIGCGSGRLLGEYKKNFGIFPEKYLGIDLSQGLLEEARKAFPDHNFIPGDMCDIEKLVGNKKFDSIFLIASFHHLENYEQRRQVLEALNNILSDEGKIYMTHWALDSDINIKKYESSRIIGSVDKFGSSDYSVKIGEYERYYHCFSLKELEYLFGESGFKIIKNELFINQKNRISIITK